MITPEGYFESKIKSADKVVGAVLKTINYENGDPGCRASFFKSKEEVCINNHFSEFRVPQPYPGWTGPGDKQAVVNGILITKY